MAKESYMYEVHIKVPTSVFKLVKLVAANEEDAESRVLKFTPEDHRYYCDIEGEVINYDEITVVRVERKGTYSL